LTGARLAKILQGPICGSERVIETYSRPDALALRSHLPPISVALSPARILKSGWPSPAFSAFYSMPIATERLIIARLPSTPDRPDGAGWC
jgi:hypothetical protein